MRIGADPEDFFVEELPLYLPSGEGLHTFVEIEKRRRTTEEVASALAREAGVAARDVGYAGRKDRHAVTRQWFSVPELDPGRAARFELPGVRVLRAARHGHKLRTGQLRGNRFRIRVCEIGGSEGARLGAGLEVLGGQGMPNRFGEQRFGRDGRNAERGLAVLRGSERPRGRREARFLVSALQAAIFNEVLARRTPPLGRLESGDLAVVHASGGLFLVTDAAHEQARADRFEISPTGPIVGRRAPEPTGRVAEREREVVAHFGLDPAEFARPGAGLRLRGGRRALRVRPDALRLEPLGEGEALLHFVLPPGAYATVLLAELRIGAAPAPVW